MVNVVLRLIPALAGLVALVTAVPAASQVGSGRIAYATDYDGIHTVRADGSEPVLLKPGSARLPRWSPDGSQIAFIEYAGMPLGVELRVMDADGTDDHVVATDADWLGIWLSRQPWSPDGSRLTWGPSPTGGTPQDFREGDVYTASAAGGDVRRITTDGRPKSPPVWSPTAPQLLYSELVLGSPMCSWELFSALDDGSQPVQITGTPGCSRNTQPSWSPSGSSVAFVRTINSESAIYVIHPDGTELHRVAEVYGANAGEPAWSPDGSKIAYTNAEHANSRYGGQEIFVVDADGSSERRLTELAPSAGFDAAPTWSPDGDQIAFKRGSLWTMNADGTCESDLGVPGAWESPSWQPVPGGPSVGLKTCRAVAIEAWAPRPEDQSATIVGGTISNEGTEPLTNVTVTISPSRSDFSLAALDGYPCTRKGSAFVCRIDWLRRGESRNVAVWGMARRVGGGRDPRDKIPTVSARLRVTADGPLLKTAREIGNVIFTPQRCNPRDRGGGYIEGTRFPDRICGRRGADDIHPGPGKDYVYAGAGPDVIHSRDVYSIYGDVISCGAGRDRVFADRKDKVSRDCERVRRG
jgi:Tol biopolymer transport system component